MTLREKIKARAFPVFIGASFGFMITAPIVGPSISWVALIVALVAGVLME